MIRTEQEIQGALRLIRRQHRTAVKLAENHLANGDAAKGALWRAVAQGREQMQGLIVWMQGCPGAEVMALGGMEVAK